MGADLRDLQIAGMGDINAMPMFGERYAAMTSIAAENLVAEGKPGNRGHHAKVDAGRLAELAKAVLDKHPEGWPLRVRV